MREWIEAGALGALALIAVVLAVLLHRIRTRTARELAAAHAETARMRIQIEEIERRMAAARPRPPRVDEEYHITELGRTPAPVAPAASTSIDSALFADLVLRETVVKAASLAHGVRRALAPESRNRIRFEVRREIRRARKQRRADHKEARRDWQSRQRAAMPGDGDGTAA